MRTPLLAICLFLFNSLHAQTSISGKIIANEDSQPVVGASISVKGGNISTTSGVDGSFTLSLPAESEDLIISYAGMKTIRLKAQPDMLIKLEPEGIFSEGIITSFGLVRQKATLGYAVQTLQTDDINKTKQNNFTSSLSGRIAGVQVKNNSNPGGSINILLRGSASLTGNNQPLFVIDGIPIDNTNSNSNALILGRNGYDYGNPIADISSENIESITVLKGASATVLYGSRAANGVIVISTKNGMANNTLAPTVKLSSTITFSNIDKSTFPEYQTEYGAGYQMSGIINGSSSYPGLEEFADMNNDGTVDTKDLTVPYSKDASRGQKFNQNVMVYQWDALYPESSNYMKPTRWIVGRNNPSTFFETGVSTTNNVELAGRNDKMVYRFAYTNFDQKGVTPNSHLSKNSVFFNGSQKITNNFQVSAQMNYINTDNKGRSSIGYLGDILSSFRQWYQVNADMKELKDIYQNSGKNATWNPTSFDDTTPKSWDNPYWAAYENYETDGRNRLLGYAQLNWDITPAFKVMARYAIDTYSELLEERRAIGSSSEGEFGLNRQKVSSGYSRFNRHITENNLDFLLSYSKEFNKSIDFSAFIGTNYRRKKVESIYQSTNGGLIVPKLYSLSNSINSLLPPEESQYTIGTNGVFGSVNLGLHDIFYLEGSVRNDISSTLPTSNRSYLYPSIAGSFVFSNLLKMDWFSFGRLRANYAKAGNEAPALSTGTLYNSSSFGGTALTTVSNTLSNSNLKPETQKSLEAGLDMIFFNDRVGLDVTVYKNNTYDQLMPLSASFTTGYSTKWINAGEIENKGIEVSLNFSLVKLTDFSWNIGVNWSKNINKVLSLYKDEAGNEITNLVLGNLQGGVSINATVGQPYGTIKGSDYRYFDAVNKTGKLVDETNGRYLKTATNDQIIGNVNPDWTGGISNSLKYKSLSFSFLIDAQKGGDIFSLDLWYGMANGLYKETVGNNDLGNPMRDPVIGRNDGTKTYDTKSGGIVEEGVLADGSVNWVRRSQSDNYATGYKSDPNARFVYDASYIKLREIALTYDLPEKLISKLYISNATFGIVASNLWIISKNLPYSDPEAIQSSGNIQGWQSGTMPATRNIGFQLNLTF